MSGRSSGYRWLVLVTLVFGAAMLNYSNMVFATRPVEMMAQYGMSQAQLTAITSIGVLPGAFFSIVLGRIFDKRGARSIRVIGTLLLVLAACCQLWRVFASSYIEVFIITFLSGTFFLPTQVLPAKIIEAWFPRREMGVAMGIYGAAAGCGIMLAFAVGALFTTSFAALMSCAIGYFLTAVLWLVFGKLPKEALAAEAQAVDRDLAKDAPAVSVKAVVKSRNMWFVMICGGLAASAPLLFNSYLVNAFLAKGMGAAGTSLLGIVFNISLVVGAIVAGIVTAKLGRYNIPYLVLCVVGGFFLFATYLVPVGALTFVCLALGGFFSAGSMSLTFARIGLLPLTGDFGPENIGIAGGMNNTAMGICMFGLPTIVAACLGANYLAVFIATFALFVIIGIVGGIVLPELGEKGKLARNARG